MDGEYYTATFPTKSNSTIFWKLDFKSNPYVDGTAIRDGYLDIGQAYPTPVGEQDRPSFL